MNRCRGCPPTQAPRSPWQVVAIQRKDTLQWAIPGGMVDSGETVSVTVKREFMEETGAPSGGNRALFENVCGKVEATT